MLSLKPRSIKCFWGDKGLSPNYHVCYYWPTQEVGATSTSQSTEAQNGDVTHAGMALLMPNPAVLSAPSRGSSWGKGREGAPHLALEKGSFLKNIAWYPFHHPFPGKIARQPL